MKKLVILSALLSFGLVHAQTTDILFLGNSYTASSNLPNMVASLATAAGESVYTESNTPGGYTLEGHSTNATSLSKIASRDWDFVVIQEQSQKPSFPPAQVAAETYPYAEILVDSIKSNYECTEPVFFMTWGRRDGDQQNCQFYPPLCTFEGMNARLRQSYTDMASNNDATVAPCGAAWQQLKFDDPTFWNNLYSGDGSHPSARGTYLNACIFYATMFRQSPVGLNYYASIGQTDAEVLQQLAEDMVIDSLDNWFVGHQDEALADIEFNQIGGIANGPDVQFINNSSNATSHNWDFGDGTTSDEESPFHTFDQGLWTVTYIATSCGGDTSTSSIQILVPLSVNDPNPLDQIQVVLQDQNITVANDLNSDLSISVLDLSGKVVWNESIGSNSRKVIDLKLNSSVYLIRLEDGVYQSTRKLFLR